MLSRSIRTGPLIVTSRHLQRYHAGRTLQRGEASIGSRATRTRSAAVKRRDAIALTPAEQKEYIANARTLTLCTHGPHGYPHAVAMWFAVDNDGALWMS